MDVEDVLRALGSDAAEAREAAELYLAVVGNPCTTRLKTVRRSVRRHLRRLFQLLGRPRCDVEALIRERAGAILGEDGVRAAAAVARELASRGATPVGASAAAVCAALEAAGRSGCVRWASEAFGTLEISLRRLLGKAQKTYQKIRGDKKERFIYRPFHKRRLVRRYSYSYTSARRKFQNTFLQDNYTPPQHVCERIHNRPPNSYNVQEPCSLRRLFHNNNCSP